MWLKHPIIFRAKHYFDWSRDQNWASRRQGEAIWLFGKGLFWRRQTLMFSNKKWHERKYVFKEDNGKQGERKIYNIEEGHDIKVVFRKSTEPLAKWWQLSELNYNSYFSILESSDLARIIGKIVGDLKSLGLYLDVRYVSCCLVTNSSDESVAASTDEDEASSVSEAAVSEEQGQC